LQLKVTTLSKEAVQFQIDGEDYSVCDIIHKELLNLKHVKFAGVAPPHPLIKTITVQFHTDGSDGSKMLSEAVANASRKIDELLELATGAFPLPVRGGVAPAENESTVVRAEIIQPEVGSAVQGEPSETPAGAAP
jgi:DNA-directed RNA polymerase subunit L